MKHLKSDFFACSASRASSVSAADHGSEARYGADLSGPSRGVLFCLCCFLILSLAGCSTLDAEWYARPDFSRRTSHAEGHTAASIAVQGLEHILWARSGGFTVLMGPCLFPVWDTEPPVLNHQAIHLHWEIQGPPESFPLEIDTGDLYLQSESKHVLPAGIYQCDVSEDFLEEERVDGKARRYILKGPGCVILPFYGVYFADLPEFTFRPMVHRNNAPVDAPSVRFRSSRSYSYDPFMIPLYFAPVR